MTQKLNKAITPSLGTKLKQKLDNIEILEKDIKVPTFSEKDKAKRGQQFKEFHDSLPSKLYHDATVDSMNAAAENDGHIAPKNGSVVNSIYREKGLPKTTPGVFMHDGSGAGTGYYSLWQIKNKLGRDPSKEEFIQHAAIAEIDPKQHSDIRYHPGHDHATRSGQMFVKPFAAEKEERKVVKVSVSGLKHRHVEPGDYFSKEHVKPSAWFHGKALEADIHANPKKYHKDITDLMGITKPDTEDTEMTQKLVKGDVISLGTKLKAKMGGKQKGISYEEQKANRAKASLEMNAQAKPQAPRQENLPPQAGESIWNDDVSPAVPLSVHVKTKPEHDELSGLHVTIKGSPHRPEGGWTDEVLQHGLNALDRGHTRLFLNTDQQPEVPAGIKKENLDKIRAAMDKAPKPDTSPQAQEARKNLLGSIASKLRGQPQ